MRMNPDQPKKDDTEIEKKLLPRLTFMAYVMYTLCIASVTFAIFAPSFEEAESEVKETGFPSVALDALAGFLIEDEEELKPTEVLNFYVVGAIFATVGIACMWIEKRKRKFLYTPKQET